MVVLGDPLERRKSRGLLHNVKICFWVSLHSNPNSLVLWSICSTPIFLMPNPIFLIDLSARSTPIFLLLLSVCSFPIFLLLLSVCSNPILLLLLSLHSNPPFPKLDRIIRIIWYSNSWDQIVLFGIRYSVFVHFQKTNNLVFVIRKIFKNRIIWYLVHIHYSFQLCLFLIPLSICWNPIFLIDLSVSCWVLNPSMDIEYPEYFTSIGDTCVNGYLAELVILDLFILAVLL